METVTYYKEPNKRIQVNTPFDELGVTGRWKIETIVVKDELGPPPGYTGDWEKDEKTVTLYIERKFWIFCFPFKEWLNENDFFDQDEEITING